MYGCKAAEKKEIEKASQKLGCQLFISKDFETSLLTRLGVSLVLWRRERLITSIATPGFIAPRP